jgi:branched-chain amino acid transport system ATP-binding protein
LALLELENVSRRFGGVVALHNVSFKVEKGEIAGLIGPNGAGKTTAFNVITRLYKPDSGQVTFDGESLLGAPPHGVVRRGIARTFQNVELFQTMTVRENVQVGTHSRRAARSGVREMLEYLELDQLAERPVAGLPYSTLKRIELARALVAEPQLLLLDEPSAGLAPRAAEQLFETIAAIHADGVAIAMVEQNALQALRLAHRGYILVDGRNSLTGRAADLALNPEVRRIFLGR